MQYQHSVKYIECIHLFDSVKELTLLVISSYFSVDNTRADRKPAEGVNHKWFLREKKVDKVNNQSV